MSVGLFSNKIEIKGFEMGNPEGFPEESLISIPLMAVQYDRSALMKKSVHITSLILHIDQVGIVKNKEGRLNVDSLNFIEKTKEKDEEKQDKEEKEEEGQEEKEGIPFKIDVLKLKMKKVVYADHSSGEKPVIEVHELNIDKTYEGIPGAPELITLVLTEAMGPTAIKGAAIYGAATVLGVGLLPVGAAVVVFGDDDAATEFSKSFEDVFSAVQETMTQMGKISKEDKEKGLIKGKASGCNITVKLERKEEEKVEVIVSAKKLMLPKPKISGGILHEISKRIESEE